MRMPLDLCRTEESISRWTWTDIPIRIAPLLHSFDKGMFVDVLRPYPCRSPEFPEKTEEYPSNSDGPVPWISKSFRFEIEGDKSAFAIRVHHYRRKVGSTGQMGTESNSPAGFSGGLLAQEAITHYNGIVSSGDLASFLDAIPRGSRNLLAGISFFNS